MNELRVGQSISSEHCQQLVCAVCVLALPLALSALVPVTVFDNFQLLRCTDVIVSVRLCGSACALPLTHDVHHGGKWDVSELTLQILRLGRLKWNKSNLCS